MAAATLSAEERQTILSSVGVPLAASRALPLMGDGKKVDPTSPPASFDDSIRVRYGTVPTYSPYVQERWELVEYVNSTVLDGVAQPVWRESSAAGGLADVYGLSRLSTSGGNESLAIADTYLEDGLGSVSAVLREGGAVAASLSYSPWGEEELATESLPGYGDRFERPHYGYNAELTSPGGGLQYLRARWYDPSMGAFGSRDSLLGGAADPATLNRYAYAEGNPVASCDPTGHESRVKYGGANANRIRRLAYNPRRGVGASTGTWMSRNYTQKALSSKKPGLLTTRRVSNPVLASGGKRRAAVQSSAKSVVSTGAGKMQTWVGAQTTGRSLTSRLAATRGGTRAAAKRSALYGQARRDRDRQMELFCTTAEYFGAPGKKNFDSDPHTTLDVMGMASGQLEPVGIAADLLNAVLYAIEGDWGNAATSGVAVVPVLSLGVAGGRLAVRTESLAKEVLSGSARVGEIVEIEVTNPVTSNIRSGKALWKSADESDAQHYFPRIVDNHALDGSSFTLTGGDGVERTLYQVEGSLNGKEGIFEWIVDPDPAKGVTHRRFIPGGSITGNPNQY